MMTQAVGYISGRSEVAYRRSSSWRSSRPRWLLDGGKRWWMACMGLWVTALLTKESAAMLPFLLLTYDWFVLDADRPSGGAVSRGWNCYAGRRRSEPEPFGLPC